MLHRHPALPRQWLMTDPRLGDAIWPILNRLPRGTGVIVRHYHLPIAERRVLFARIRRIAARRGLILVVAGSDPLGRGGDGVHGRDPHRLAGLRTWPTHNRREAIAGKRARADLLFISPLKATRSHPGARPLGICRAMTIGRNLGIPMIALGGVGPEDARWLCRASFHGWAGIDAWLMPGG